MRHPGRSFTIRNGGEQEREKLTQDNRESNEHETQVAAAYARSECGEMVGGVGLKNGL